MLTYRVEGKDARHFVPLGFLIRQPSEALAEGPGECLAPVAGFGGSEGLACEAAGEGVSAFGERVAAVLGVGHEFSDGDITWWVWWHISMGDRSMGDLPRKFYFGDIPNGNFGTHAGGSKTIVAAVRSIRKVRYLHSEWVRVRDRPPHTKAEKYIQL